MTVNMSAYDVEAIRKDFPILELEVHGKPLTYLDNAASAQKPKAMLDRVQQAYSAEYANVHRGLHYLSNLATDNFENARETVRRFINAPSVDEVIFTRSATEAINLAAFCLGERLGEGDEIVLSIMEHHANIVPWHMLRQRKGVALRWAPIDDEGVFLVDEFVKLLGPKTKIVALTHMSNVLGTVTPIREIAAICRERGIILFVDGSQGAVHMPVDVQALGCDFYCFTGHKTYGPTGIGVLWGRKALLDSMPPFNGGGEMIDVVTTETVTYGKVPHRFEAGTPPIVQAIGLAASLEYMERIGRSAIAAHEASLGAYAHDQLSKINSLRIIGTAPGKGAIISFALGTTHAHDVSTVLDRYGVAVRAGTHCAMPLLERFGVTSTCRASIAMYNTRAEVDRLVEAVDKARMFFE
ncbi:MAG: cysteine desulfurase [Rhodobiaceae bacterium]|nr:cysteine desulfurase [Rhodobiaceae bacterium]MCC0056960.1 cysteine desulfurase [Rhodobiaceae bacterium]